MSISVNWVLIWSIWISGQMCVRYLMEFIISQSRWVSHMPFILQILNYKFIGVWNKTLDQYKSWEMWIYPFKMTHTNSKLNPIISNGIFISWRPILFYTVDYKKSPTLLPTWGMWHCDKLYFENCMSFIQGQTEQRNKLGAAFWYKYSFLCLLSVVFALCTHGATDSLPCAWYSKLYK